MEKFHKLLLSAMVFQTLVLGSLVLFAVHPVRVIQTVEVVVTPTPTPRLLGKDGKVATPTATIR